MKVRADDVAGHFLGKRYRLGEEVRLVAGPHTGRSAIVRNSFKCARNRQQAQLRKRSVDCFAMLLSNEGAVGLDLSFVTHIFLLDKIWNPSLEKQVIARAHRMGATQPAVIDQCVMRNSVEHLMHEFRDDTQVSNAVEADAKDKAKAGKAKGKGKASSSKQFQPPMLRGKSSSTKSSTSAASNAEESSIDEKKVHYLLQNARMIRTQSAEAAGGSELESGDRRVRFAAASPATRLYVPDHHALDYDDDDDDK